MAVAVVAETASFASTAITTEEFGSVAIESLMAVSASDCETLQQTNIHRRGRQTVAGWNVGIGGVFIRGSRRQQAVKAAAQIRRCRITELHRSREIRQRANALPV